MCSPFGEPVCAGKGGRGEEGGTHSNWEGEVHGPTGTPTTGPRRRGRWRHHQFGLIKNLASLRAPPNVFGDAGGGCPRWEEGKGVTHSNWEEGREPHWGTAMGPRRQREPGMR